MTELDLASDFLCGVTAVESLVDHIQAFSGVIQDVVRLGADRVALQDTEVGQQPVADQQVDVVAALVVDRHSDVIEYEIDRLTQRTSPDGQALEALPDGALGDGVNLMWSLIDGIVGEPGHGPPH